MVGCSDVVDQQVDRPAVVQVSPGQTAVLPAATPPVRAPAVPLAHRVRRVRLLYRVANRLERSRFARRWDLDHRDRRLVRSAGRLRFVGDREVDRPETVMAESSAWVHSVARAAGVATIEVPHDTGRRHRVGVLGEDWGRLLAALREGGADVFVSYPAVDATGRRTWASVAPASAPPEIVDQRVLHVGRWVRDPRSGTVHGPELGCEVERWDRETPSTVYVAPRPNRLTSRVAVPPDEPPTGSARRISLPGRGTDTPFVVGFPVDVVITWVDGGDDAWRARRDAALALALGQHASSTTEARYRDNGELRYALRSVYRHLPWVRRIHLVTDDQVPPWLVESEGLRVVSHRELFAGTGVEHSFNSHAISARLHHVPGLSDHFLYSNDDVFIGRPLGPERFFFSNGVARIFPSRSTLPPPEAAAGLPHEEARRNAARLVGAQFGRQPTQNFKHVPFAMSREVLIDLERRFGDELARTWRSPFRSVDDVEIGWLHHYGAYLQGRAVTSEIAYDFFNVSAPAAWRRMRRLRARRDVDVFCVNDDENLSEQMRDERIRGWLERYFPEPCPHERPEPAAPRSYGEGLGK